MKNTQTNRTNFFNLKIRKVLAPLVLSIHLAGQIGVDLRGIELNNANINAQMSFFLRLRLGKYSKN